jgi:hypothetical protein
MAPIDLSVGDVQDMTKYSADRRAHGVQDTKRLVGRRRHKQTWN